MQTLRQTMISAACLLGALASVPTAWAAAPVFGGGAVASASVDENNATSYDFSATDTDADTLAYSKSGPDEAHFIINAVTGELSFSQAFDFDNPADTGQDNVYNVTVTVSDGTETVTQAFGLTVTDLNETPVFTSGSGATGAFAVEENATAIGSVTAHDDENDVLAFSITGGTDASKFDLNGTTGALSFVSGQNLDTPSFFVNHRFNFFF